jgi:hypothetical protein
MVAVLAAVFLPVCSGAGEDYIKINDLTMRLDRSDALFEFNYTLDSFAKLYVLALGCKYMEPDLQSMLGSYGDVKVVRADPYSAALLASGAGEKNSNYYLFESKPLGSRVSRLTIVYPAGQYRTFYNVSSTPNVFCEAGSNAPWRGSVLSQ